MPDAKEEFLIVPGLIIGIGPREELKSIIPEMHGDFSEDPSFEVNSMVEVLRRREDDFGGLNVARIQIDRAFAVGDEFGLDIVRRSL